MIRFPFRFLIVLASAFFFSFAVSPALRAESPAPTAGMSARPTPKPKPRLKQRSKPKRAQVRSKKPVAAPSLAAGPIASSAPANPAAVPPAPAPPRLETAIIGGGCFWCVEGCYLLVDGVEKVVSGYAGGKTPNPTYKQVLTGETGHAEVVQVTFDANKIDYEQIIDLFWESHDPTQLNRQGDDIGTQYRSIILFENNAQREAAQRSLARAQRAYRKQIATEVAPLARFWVAESFNQDYFKRHPGAPYCKAVIAPKVRKFQDTLVKDQ